MKAALIVTSAFWTAVAVFGFWGFAGFLLAASAVVWMIERRS